MHPPPDLASEVATDLQLASWTEGTKVSKDGTGHEYSLTLKSQIWCRTSGKKMTLEKCVKEVHPMCKDIFGYIPFPAGTPPKMLTAQPGSIKKFDSKRPDRLVVLQAIEAARGTASCIVVLILEYDATRNRLQPLGLTLIATKQMVVPAGGELIVQ